MDPVVNISRVVRFNEDFSAVEKVRQELGPKTSLTMFRWIYIVCNKARKAGL